MSRLGDLARTLIRLNDLRATPFPLPGRRLRADSTSPGQNDSRILLSFQKFPLVQMTVKIFDEFSALT